MDVKILFAIASDLLVNLSAGWFGALLIIPNYSDEKGKRKMKILTMDIALGTLCLVVAYIFRNF